MTRKFFLLPLFFFFTVFQVFSFGAREKPKELSPEEMPRRERLAVLDAMEKLWAEKDIKAYSVRLSSARGAFPPRLVSMTVRDGLVTECGAEPAGKNDESEFFASLTAESLFARLRRSLEDGPQGPMELAAEYDSEYGYIRRLRRVPARHLAEAGQAPRDTGYSIEVLDFSVLP